MGTRADFYVGRGLEAEWIGSYPWDGHPEGIGADVLNAKSEQSYRSAVADLLTDDRATLPEQGWPWPWDDSRTTDFAYAFDSDKVWASGYGSPWFDPLISRARDEDGDPVDPPGPLATFPDMSERKAVTYGERSGLIMISIPKG